MIYVVTEDTNSARDFWKIVFHTFLDASQFQFVPLLLNTIGIPVGGNTMLETMVNIALNQASSGDCLFVAFDNIGSPYRLNKKTNKRVNFDSGDFLISTNQKCINMGVEFYFTSYYCFEELYLSYSELYRLYKEDGKDIILLEVLDYVKNHILNGTEYYDRNNFNVQTLIDIKSDAGKNKEHFADALLMQITRRIQHGKFEIRKQGNSGITKCWTMECEYLHNHVQDLKQEGYICNNCKYKMKEQSSREKLVDLSNNSLKSISGISFIEFITRF